MKKKFRFQIFKYKSVNLKAMKVESESDETDTICA